MVGSFHDSVGHTTVTYNVDGGGIAVGLDILRQGLREVTQGLYQVIGANHPRNKQ
jgi:acetyl-CoA acetyltransferase